MNGDHPVFVPNKKLSPCLSKKVKDCTPEELAYKRAYNNYKVSLYLKSEKGKKASEARKQKKRERGEIRAKRGRPPSI